MLIYFYKNLVKVREVWLRKKMKWPICNRGSMLLEITDLACYYYFFHSCFRQHSGQTLNLIHKMCCWSCKKRTCTSRKLKKVLVLFTSLGCINSNVVYWWMDSSMKQVRYNYLSKFKFKKSRSIRLMNV